MHYELNNRHRENNVNLDPLLLNTQLIDFAQQRNSPWQTISEPKTPRSQMQSTAQRIQQNQARNAWMSECTTFKTTRYSFSSLCLQFPAHCKQATAERRITHWKNRKRGGKNQKLFLQRRRIECYWKPIQALQALYTTLVVETSKIVELQSSPSPFSPPADVDLGYTLEQCELCTLSQISLRLLRFPVQVYYLAVFNAMLQWTRNTQKQKHQRRSAKEKTKHTWMHTIEETDF